MELCGSLGSIQDGDDATASSLMARLLVAHVHVVGMIVTAAFIHWPHSNLYLSRSALTRSSSLLRFICARQRSICEHTVMHNTSGTCCQLPTGTGSVQSRICARLALKSLQKTRD